MLVSAYLTANPLITKGQAHTHVYYEVFSEILSEEEVIHKVIVAKRSDSSLLFYTRKLPDGPFEETTNWRDDISEKGCLPTPKDLP